MIEFHSEAGQTWESFQRPGLHVGMTNGADRAVGIRELLRVTTSAWQVITRAGSLGNGRVRIATMAEQAWQSRMVSCSMLELGIIQTFGKLHLAL
jgi:hypothetical protein